MALKALVIPFFCGVVIGILVMLIIGSPTDTEMLRMCAEDPTAFGCEAMYDYLKTIEWYKEVK